MFLNVLETVGEARANIQPFNMHAYAQTLGIPHEKRHQIDEFKSVVLLLDDKLKKSFSDKNMIGGAVLCPGSI